MKIAKGLIPSVLAALTGILPAMPAFADKTTDTLNMAWEGSLASLDFYFTNSAEAQAVALNVCDGLIYIEPTTLELQPLLATSWEFNEPRRIDLELRQGVTFHNGAPVTADDIVWTLNHFADPASGTLQQWSIDWIDRVEKVDDTHIHIYTKTESRSSLEYLTWLEIYPKAYYEEVGTSGFSNAPVCSGPYKVESVNHGADLTLVRNDDYFEGGPKAAPAIERVFIRSIQDSNTRLAELMTGGVDWLPGVTQDQADQLARVPGIEVMQSQQTRVHYIFFNPITPPTDSPITDPVVRRAFAHAINRDAIVNNLIRGEARRLDTICHPMQSGCLDGVFAYDYNPEKAQELLAEAGYPDGFTIDLYAYRDRFVTEAIIGDLQKVGITANLKYMQYGALDQDWRDGKLPMAHSSFGNNFIDAGLGLSSHFLATDSITQDPEIQDAIEKALVAQTVEERDALYAVALKKLAADAYWVPLFTGVANSAATEGLSLVPSLDSPSARFFTASWK